jgi:(S)-sulfolactate dehydrogenase
MADILIPEFMDEAAVERLKASFSVHYEPELHTDAGRFAAAIADCRALIVRNGTQVRGAPLAAAARLEVVGRLGVGLDNIDVEACAARGIAVIPATGANAISVAELVIGAIIVLMRGAYFVTDRIRAGEWPRQQMVGREIFGKTLGIVGFGNVGSAVAERARALGMVVQAHDPYVPDTHPQWAEKGAVPASLERVLAESDVLSLHVPLTDETRGMIGAAELARLRPGAIVINTARGSVVDEQALADALRSGQVAAAFVDVFAREPFDPASPLATAPNVILTPHLGAMTAESNARVCTMICDAVTAHLQRPGR